MKKMKGPNLLILGHLARGGAREKSTGAKWEFTIYLQWEGENEVARPTDARWGFTVYLQWEVRKEQASPGTGGHERTCARQILPRV